MRKNKLFLGLVFSLIVLIIWTLWENTSLQLNTYIVESEDLSDSFDSFRIAHVSDVHNTEIGKENEKLLKMLEEANPDIIAITGDLIDSRNTNVKIAVQFVKNALEIAPCYYVTGNHEARVVETNELIDELVKLGVVVLEDKKVEIEVFNEKISIIGMNDPSFDTDYLYGDDETVISNKLQNLMSETDEMTILLSHRPELFDIYVENECDLVLSGHAHGGQFRLPFIGGLVAPNQGFFPKYDAGLYSKENTKMIVSRGIGNSIIPLRFNNRPEVILIELKANI